jgi:hypothetical protein
MKRVLELVCISGELKTVAAVPLLQAAAAVSSRRILAHPGKYGIYDCQVDFPFMSTSQPW